MISEAAQLSQPLSEATAPDSNCAYSFDSTVLSEDLVRSSTHRTDHYVSDSEASDTDLSRKPEFPYVVGFTTVATRHEPPEPFGHGYDTTFPKEQENWETLSQTEYCLSRPPLDGHSLCDDTMTLTITASIDIGTYRGAQLVVVNDTMVAKIYDPFYYEGGQELGYKENVIWNADGDYSREALAYMEIQNSPAAKDVTPAFYGTWTISIESLVRKGGQVHRYSRQVPFILLEYLQGESMEYVKVRALHRHARSRLLKKALDAEIIIYHAGISNDDFCPRNIMISGLDYDHQDDTIKNTIVKVIDFNVAAVLRHPQYHYRMYRGLEEGIIKKWHPRLVSPIVRYFGQMSDFSTEGWCSGKDGAPEKWLWEHYHNDKRYIPVVWDPNDADSNPEYADGWPQSKNSSDSGVGLDVETEEGGESGSEDDSVVSEQTLPATQSS